MRIPICSLALLGLFLVSALFATPSTASAAAPQTNIVVSLGAVNASQVSSGLGFGISQPGYVQDWEFAAAKAAGASWVRIQCPWSSVEQQTAPPLNTAAGVQFIQAPSCVSALTSAARYGLSVTEVAAFGPPFHQILYATIPNGASVGATSLNIQLLASVGGDGLNSMVFPYDYWCPVQLGDNGLAGSPYQCSYVPTSRFSTQGALITGSTQTDSTHATINLASALTMALPKNPGVATGCSMVAETNTLTCTSANFNPAYMGNLQLVIPGAASFGATFTTTMSSYLSPTQITVPCCAHTSVSNITVQMNLLYAIGEILYPSTATANPADASVIAYGNYVNFLANDMAARGVTGEIEIWNEPPWTGDPWDFRPDLYDYAVSGAYTSSTDYAQNAVVVENSVPFVSLVDSNLGHDPASSPLAWSSTLPSNVDTQAPGFGANFGFAANLQHRTSFPPGVTAVWNGTSGSGYASLLAGGMSQYSGEVLNQPSTVIARESFHPYGGTYGYPEDMMGIPSCLMTAAAATGEQGNPYNCYLPGSPQTANIFYAVYLDEKAKLVNPTYGIGHSITETNTIGNTSGQRMQQARFDLRHFLGFEAMGVTPIEFFQLWDDTHNDPSFSFVDYKNSTMTPLANYTAMAGLMADIRPISNPPAAPYSPSTLPAVTSYTGTYPLSTLHMVGSLPGATGNSDAFVIWQLSSCLTTSNCWMSIASPAAGPVTVNIPAGMQAVAVTNLTTRAAVAHTTLGQSITLSVADDPVEMMVEPITAATTLTLTATRALKTYGSPVVLSATLAPYTAQQHSTNGENIAFYNGSILLGSGTLSSGVATLTVSTLPAGNDLLTAIYAGDANFSPSSTALSLSVTAAIPLLVFTPVPNQTFGAPPFHVSATSPSTGAVAYSIVSGPATVLGNTVTPTGTGTVVLKASQAAAGNYATATAEVGFTVSAPPAGGKTTP